MDRDRSENNLDPVERVSPATGDNDAGDVGEEAAGVEADKAALEPNCAPGRTL